MTFRLNTTFLATLLSAAPITILHESALATGDCLSTSLGPALSAPSGSPYFYLPAYDSMRNVTVAIIHSGETFEFINDQWIATGATLTSANFSSPNFTGSIAYRSATGHTLFLTPGAGLWTWDGLQWQQESEAPLTPRFNTSLAYDPYRDVLIVFGGHLPPGPNNPTDEMWEYDFGSMTWMQIMFDDGPAARQRAGFVFDPSRNVAILFGGRSAASQHLGDTWQYDPATGQWTEYDFGGLATPPARERPPMAYHGQLQAIVLSGGNLGSGDHLADYWVFDGERWVQRFAGFGAGMRGPITYDSVSNVTRQFIEHPYNHLRIHSSGGVPTILTQPVNQTVNLGQPVQFTVKAAPWVDSTPLAYQWRKNGQPIPGANLSAYTIFAATDADMGGYDCIVTHAGFGDLHCGKAVSIAATLTVKAATCAADLSGDGNVGVADLLILLGAWGRCP